MMTALEELGIVAETVEYLPDDMIIVGTLPRYKDGLHKGKIDWISVFHETRATGYTGDGLPWLIVRGVS